jgi:hypothetical protein
MTAESRSRLNDVEEKSDDDLGTSEECRAWDAAHDFGAEVGIPRVLVKLVRRP